MNKVFPSNKKKFSLSFTVSSTFPQKVKVMAFDKRKPHSYYYNTAGTVDKKGRSFNLGFPLSPNELVVRIFPEKFSSYNDYINYGNPIEKSLKVTNTKLGELKTYPLWLSKGDLSFIKFAENFATNAAIYSATQKGDIPSVYKSDDGQFTIYYFDVIKDKQGKIVHTPARIGHNSGSIEVSKKDFLNYTIQGRMAILLHEYAHKFINPKKGLKMSDETGADINALNIYLSRGYSPVEAHLVFLKVFSDSRGDQNHKRYLFLKDYIQKFLKGEVSQFYKNITGGKK